VLSGRVRGVVANAVRRWNTPRVYKARHGIGRGFKQVGGISLILPSFVQWPSEYPEFAGLEEAFLRGLDLKDKTVYDVGAFEGILPLFFAQQTGPEGRVVAFEPVPESYRRILQHIELNEFADRVTVRNIGVGSGSGELAFATAAADGLGRATADEEIQRMLRQREERLQVFHAPVNSLDNEIASFPLPEPDFVKIDVEGMELDVLQGMRQTISRRKPELYIEMHGADIKAKRENAARVVQFLSDHGYSIRHVESDQPVDPSTFDRAVRGRLYCVLASQDRSARVADALSNVMAPASDLT
jgi:FkbM family methyltransferase